MTLSEAIRLGSMLVQQQCFDETFQYSRNTIVASCAIGAAIQATGGPIAYTYRHVCCPGCSVVMVMVNIVWVIIHLNDHHRWTREQIADWVETCESADVEQPVEELVSA